MAASQEGRVPPKPHISTSIHGGKHKKKEGEKREKEELDFVPCFHAPVNRTGGVNSNTAGETEGEVLCGGTVTRKDPGERENAGHCRFSALGRRVLVRLWGETLRPGGKKKKGDAKQTENRSTGGAEPRQHKKPGPADQPIQIGPVSPRRNTRSKIRGEGEPVRCEKK